MAFGRLKQTQGWQKRSLMACRRSKLTQGWSRRSECPIEVHNGPKDGREGHKGHVEGRHGPKDNEKENGDIYDD